MNTQKHYNSKSKKNLYQFAEDFRLNAYEFDLIKRIVRCRHKGSFTADLEKTKHLIDIYIADTIVSESGSFEYLKYINK